VHTAYMHGDLLLNEEQCQCTWHKKTTVPKLDNSIGAEAVPDLYAVSPQVTYGSNEPGGSLPLLYARPAPLQLLCQPDSITALCQYQIILFGTKGTCV